MRIAYITGCYPRASDSFVREEIAALRRLGLTVKTYAVRRPDDAEVRLSGTADERAATDYLLDPVPAAWVAALVLGLRHPVGLCRGVLQTLKLRTPGVRGHLWPWAYLLEALVLARLLRRDRIEHLHDHISEGSAAVAMLASALTGVPWSMTVHGPGEFERAERLHLDVKTASAAFVVTISDYARGQLLRWVRPEDWGRVHVVRCGVAPRFLNAGAADPAVDDSRVVCVARLDAVKGQRLLISALALLRADGVALQVTLIGDGPDRPVIEAAVQRHGLAPQVRFLGWAAGSVVQDELLAARALVLPSLAEGLPVVIMESLALGRPVVATDVAAVRELVTTGRTGWLVQPGDVVSLANALREVAEADPQQLHEMGRLGARAVKERHDIDANAVQLGRLIAGQAAGLP